MVAVEHKCPSWSSNSGIDLLSSTNIVYALLCSGWQRVAQIFGSQSDILLPHVISPGDSMRIGFPGWDLIDLFEAKAGSVTVRHETDRKCSGVRESTPSGAAIAGARIQCESGRTDAGMWTCRRFAELIRDKFGVEYHHCHVWRILRSLGWTCQKPEDRALERNEDAILTRRQERWPAIKINHTS